MNAYLRNGMIALAINVIIFLMGWGCIVPDTVDDKTWFLGFFGDVEITKGNTAVVFGVSAILSTLTSLVALVEAIAEDLYHRPRWCPNYRSEKPKKTPKISGKRITDPTAPEDVPEEDPAVPKMD